MIASAAALPPPPPALRVPGGHLAAAPALPGAPGAVPADLAGWEVRGVVRPVPVALSDGRPAVRLVANTSLVTPPVAVAAGAQTVTLALASRSGTLVEVSAEPVDGGPPAALGTVAPTAAAGPAHVPVAVFAGRTVRLVLDPTGPFGATVDVAAVGPLRAPLPGWTVLAGAPAPPVRGTLTVADEVLDLRAPALALPGDARFLRVGIRGSGAVRFGTGARAVRGAAGAAWRDLRVPVAPGRPVVLRLLVDPRGGRVHLRDLGVVVRRVRLVSVRARAAGPRVLVTATAGRTAAGLPVRVLDGGTVVGAARVGAAGRVRLVVRPRRGARVLRLEVAGDRDRVGAVAAVRVRR